MNLAVENIILWELEIWFCKILRNITVGGNTTNNLIKSVTNCGPFYWTWHGLFSSLDLDLKDDNWMLALKPSTDKTVN